MTGQDAVSACGPQAGSASRLPGSWSDCREEALTSAFSGNGALPAKTGISPREQLSKRQGWEVIKSENQSGQDELGYRECGKI